MSVTILKQIELQEPKEMILTADVFVREHSEHMAEMHKIGDSVVVSGEDRSILHYGEFAVYPDDPKAAKILQELKAKAEAARAPKQSK